MCMAMFDKMSGKDVEKHIVMFLCGCSFRGAHEKSDAVFQLRMTRNNFFMQGAKHKKVPRSMPKVLEKTMAEKRLHAMHRNA